MSRYPFAKCTIQLQYSCSEESRGTTRELPASSGHILHRATHHNRGRGRGHLHISTCCWCSSSSAHFAEQQNVSDGTKHEDDRHGDDDAKKEGRLDLLLLITRGECCLRWH